MDLSLTNEQQLLQDSIRKFISTQYSLSERNKFIKEDQGYDSSNWQQFADLGWLAMTFSEEYGGLGGSTVDSMIMLEEFGKRLVVEPFLSTVVLFGAEIESTAIVDKYPVLDAPVLLDILQTGLFLGCQLFGRKSHPLGRVLRFQAPPAVQILPVEESNETCGRFRLGGMSADQGNQNKKRYEFHGCRVFEFL